MSDLKSPLSVNKTNRLNVLPINPEIEDEERAVGLGRFPSWLHRKLPKGSDLKKTSEIIAQNRLHTVCEEAKCPNLLECWSKKTATFLVMGKECTRNCGFCDIDFTKQPKAIDEDEPHRVADSVKQLGLKHVVLTMVARDDLPDGGSGHLVKVINAIREEIDEVTIEVLTSDFAGNLDALKKVLEAKPEIFNHNIETVRELTPRVRHKATYERTLEVLKFASSNRIHPDMKVKSGLMVGLGENEDQVYQTLQDMKEAGCDIVTMGQYLQPKRQKLLVKAFVTPEQFKKFEDYGHHIGIPYMYCGPFIRSSYNADLVLTRANQRILTINSH
ncbi:MAG: lipoyl synthase [Parachlamydiaceae bacterium]|nr:lipoyl synthase [Parachlamydiaceae bacterium]